MQIKKKTASITAWLICCRNPYCSFIRVFTYSSQPRSSEDSLAVLLPSFSQAPIQLHVVCAHFLPRIARLHRPPSGLAQPFSQFRTDQELPNPLCHFGWRMRRHKQSVHTRFNYIQRPTHCRRHTRTTTRHSLQQYGRQTFVMCWMQKQCGTLIELDDLLTVTNMPQKDHDIFQVGSGYLSS